MEGHTSPRSQASLRDDRYQHESLSIGALMQNSAAVLENECVELDREIEEKTRKLQEMKDNCAKQADNNAKQKLDLEHLKMKTYTEAMNRDAFLKKYSSFTGKSETLQGYLGEWYKGLNQAMSAKDDRQQFAEYFGLKIDPESAEYQRLEQEYNSALQQVDEILGGLEEYRMRARREFDEIKSELKSQLALQAQHESELEEQLRGVQKECAEKTVVIQVLKQQNEDLLLNEQPLKNNLAAEMKNVESVTNQLQTSLQEELTRKASLSTKLEVADKLIYETNISLRDKESEIKLLDSKHKQLISEQGENNNRLTVVLGELNHLQADHDSKRTQFNYLSEVDGENSSLKIKIDELNKTYEIYKKKLGDITVVEDSYRDELEKIKKFIEENKIEIDNVTKERSYMEEEIRKLKKEFEDNALEQNKARSETNKCYAELEEENNSFMVTFNELAEQLKDVSEEKDKFENLTTNLKKELKRAKAIFEETDCKLFSYLDESQTILSGLREQRSLVGDMVALTQRDCEQAQRDVVEGEQLKVEVTQLEADLTTRQAEYVQTLADLQVSYTEQLETKKETPGRPQSSIRGRVQEQGAEEVGCDARAEGE
uniref:Uncharacterized protein n=1 Tax=Graphocephala atropunctata TaxID=36148 RepID=A0A1B6KIW7_9HEMI